MVVGVRQAELTEVSEAGPGLLLLLPQPPKYWDMSVHPHDFKTQPLSKCQQDQELPNTQGEEKRTSLPLASWPWYMFLPLGPSLSLSLRGLVRFS